MIEPIITAPLRSAAPPPLPPRVRPIPAPPPPLPPRRVSTLAVSVAVEQRVTTEHRSYTEVSQDASCVNAAGAPETQSTTGQSLAAERVTTTKTATFKIAGPSLPNPGATISSTPIQSMSSSTPQDGPKLPSLVLSLILKEPLERSHGRISTLTAVQSLFKSVPMPDAPPFEFSSLIDHALLAGQIALHDPHMRQQKRLPLVITLSIGAFLVAATAIIPRYFGWLMLALASWFGPGRFLMTELWYISVIFVVLALLVDIFPMLSLCTLLWTSVIAISKTLETREFGSNNGKRGIGIPLIQSTAGALQNGSDIKPVALDIVQNVTEWWTFRQTESERQRRAEAKTSKEEKKIEKLQRSKTEKEMKKAQIQEKESERLKQEKDKETERLRKETERMKKMEEELELNRVRAQEKEAERLRKEDEKLALKRTMAEQFDAEKQRKRDEEMALKRSTSEAKEAEKQRKREQELVMKRIKIEEKEAKKRKEIEEREQQKQEKLQLEHLRRMQEEETKREKLRLKEITKLKKAELAAQAQQLAARSVDVSTTSDRQIDLGINTEAESVEAPSTESNSDTSKDCSFRSDTSDDGEIIGELQISTPSIEATVVNINE